MKDRKKLAIGFFDSGMGGISVLAEGIRKMPKENFIYFGDSKNAPYGEKTTKEVIDLSKKGCDFLMEKGVKAIVVACNTATSAAIQELRSSYDIPIIGMEPALKPAVEMFPNGNIAVMATNMTLKEKKFSDLMEKYGKTANIIKLPCPRLVELVERGVFQDPEMERAIESYYEDIDIKSLDAIVLGCTHFIYLKGSIRKVLGDNVKIIDGNEGTVNHLHGILKESDLLNDSDFDCGDVHIYNSREDIEIKNLAATLLEFSLGQLK